MWVAIEYCSGQSLSRVQLCWTVLHGLQHTRLPYPSPTPGACSTHVHLFGDAIQPSHSLSSPSPPVFNRSQHQGLIQWVIFSYQWPRYWSFNFSISLSNEYSGLISFTVDRVDLPAVQETQKSSPTLHFKSINSSVLSFLYSPTLISTHDYRKKHSFEYVEFVSKVMFLLFNKLYGLVIAFLPRSKCLLIS